MLLFSQLYLHDDDCGAPAGAATAVREALVPLQNEALTESFG
jgi:hypothetical protein